MRDYSRLVVEIQAGGLLAGESSALSYLFRFVNEQPMDLAVSEAAQAGWDSSMYADQHGIVLRLTRRGRLTSGVLERDRGWVESFSRAHGGQWIAFTVEAVNGANFWERVAERFDPPAKVPVQRTSSELATSNTTKLEKATG